MKTDQQEGSRPDKPAFWRIVRQSGVIEDYTSFLAANFRAIALRRLGEIIVCEQINRREA